MIIREMILEDIEQVSMIEAANFSTPWSKSAFQEEIQKNDKAVYLVGIDDEEKVVGYLGFWAIFDEGHITNVAVRKQNQGNGIGSKLIEAMMAYGRRHMIEYFTLEVRESNHTAIRLYEKYGFVEAGIRKNFYTHPTENAMIMWLKN